MPMSTLYLHHKCPCFHSEPQPPPISPGDPLRPAGRSVPGSYGVTTLPWVPTHVKSCVCPPRLQSLSPPVLWSSCDQAQLAFKAKCSRGSSSPLPDPQTGEPDMGLRTLTPLRELLRYDYFPVCGLPTCLAWDLIVLQMHPSYCLVMASSLSLEVESLFW